MLATRVTDRVANGIHGASPTRRSPSIISARSEIFGGYDRFGALTAFTVGASAALVAGVGLWILIPGHRPTVPAR